MCCSHRKTSPPVAGRPRVLKVMLGVSTLRCLASCILHVGYTTTTTTTYIGTITTTATLTASERLLSDLQIPTRITTCAEPRSPQLFNNTTFSDGIMKNPSFINTLHRVRYRWMSLHGNTLHWQSALGCFLGTKSLHRVSALRHPASLLTRVSASLVPFRGNSATAVWICFSGPINDLCLSSKALTLDIE